MLITMSEEELHRIGVIKGVCNKQLTQMTAASMLGLTRRHIQRLVNQFRQDGEVGLVSKRRGQASNRRFLPEFREKVFTLVKQKYADFKPTFACEKLAELHGIKLSSETLRQWLITEGLWRVRKRKQKKIYQPRYRRECYGDLVQIDGSHHDWFEGRSAKCCLLVFIDDATSQLMSLRFCESETSYDYMNITREYIDNYGKPIAFYSDKHSVFKVNSPSRKSSKQMTQYGRILYELNIELICANSSQAKGRVERANRTLQDRLIKEMRLAGINTIEEANAWLPEFMADFNRRFACSAYSSQDAHRPAQESAVELDDIFTRQSSRTVSNSLTLQYDKVIYLLDPTDKAKRLVNKRVMIYDYPDGTIALRYCGEELTYSVFDTLRHVQQGEIVSNKRLGAALAFAKESQEERAEEHHRHRNKKAGSRKAQARCINPVFMQDVEFKASLTRD
ncbi:ISNCY family transposase [Shewanella surugensis]|uniref:ISNCY family transposase n=2 Tax=Shewanella surugensis TaxID=212020 RepID=A0ABT0L8W2_9GAMM|nr:ISNCY family transposase [Shewanella surugensis]MCL1124143.1 ISNCY family transposase [Shewanella surugensis]